MKLIVKTQSRQIPIRDMNDGQLAVVSGDQFYGEVIYRNVAGWHSLSGDRFWPSAYIERSSGSYVPDLMVTPLEDGDSITIESTSRMSPR